MQHLCLEHFSEFKYLHLCLEHLWAKPEHRTGAVENAEPGEGGRGRLGSFLWRNYQLFAQCGCGTVTATGWAQAQPWQL